MNKKENGTLFFFDSPPATCPLDPSPARPPPSAFPSRRIQSSHGSPTATLLRLHPSRRPHRGMRQ
ncbi:hypothetical protein ES332_D04G101800v1 [Gossypium tomentosum]|uniref:Uncharacterized protein n=1 Tax=Gossypium tomentosum TaxID=34277 RepID=A0A5D2LCC8_GOSTO|nr:hypothetical protein ES332_D04G101800v1 [Gossypium tomentosum]